MSERIVVSGDLEQITATVDGSAIHVVVSEVDGGGGGGADLSDALPAAPGTPAAGTDTEASRSDHVHAPPTPGQIGAATPGDVASAIAAASLDGGQIQSGFVPDVHIPASIARDSEVAAAVTAHTSAVDPHGDRAHADAAAAAVQAASQPVDSDLTAIAALSTTSFGRALLEQADAAALRTVAGLGTAATRNVGSGAGTVTAGDDSRLADARTPTAHVHTATDITSGTVSTARLGTGAANATTFLRGDQTWAAPAGGGVETVPYLASNYYGPSLGDIITSGSGYNALGRMSAHAVYLPAGNYQSLSVVIGVPAVSTWALGIYGHDPATMLPCGTALIKDCGTISTNSTGLISASGSFTIPTSGIYWVCGLCVSFTATPKSYGLFSGSHSVPNNMWIGNMTDFNLFPSAIGPYIFGLSLGTTLPSTFWAWSTPLYRATSFCPFIFPRAAA